MVRERGGIVSDAPHCMTCLLAEDHTKHVGTQGLHKRTL